MKKFAQLSFEALGNYFPKNYQGHCSELARKKHLELWDLGLHSGLSKEDSGNIKIIGAALDRDLPDLDEKDLICVMSLSTTMFFPKIDSNFISRHKGTEAKGSRWMEMVSLANQFINKSEDLIFFFEKNSDSMHELFLRKMMIDLALLKGITSNIGINLTMYCSFVEILNKYPWFVRSLENKGFNVGGLLNSVYNSFLSYNGTPQGPLPVEILEKSVNNKKTIEDFIKGNSPKYTRVKKDILVKKKKRKIRFT